MGKAYLEFVFGIGFDGEQSLGFIGYGVRSTHLPIVSKRPHAIRLRAEREARLAAALRANLARRREQQRGQQEIGIAGSEAASAVPSASIPVGPADRADLAEDPLGR